MATIPGSYKEIYTIKNDSAEHKKLLKAVFLLGPSKAVVTSGNILVDSKVSEQESDEEEADNNTNDSVSDNTQDTDEEHSNESYHYSMLEAFSRLNLNHVYEADDNDSDSDSDNDDSQSSQDSDGSDSDNSEEDSSNEDEFNETTDLEIISNLQNEGCTKWHVRLNSHVTDTTKVINALKSKKFKAAYDIANSQAAKSVEGTSAEGFEILSATTMIDKKKENLAPFIGRCRWAFDVGSDDNNKNAFDLEFAIAPIDGKSKKPVEKTIYHTVYNIIGDITNGQLEGFEDIEKLKSLMSDDSNDENNDPTKTLSGWLHKKFKCVGDSSMYKEFLKARKFVEDNLKKKTIEFNKDESNNVINYTATLKSAKSFIVF